MIRANLSTYYLHRKALRSRGCVRWDLTYTFDPKTYISCVEYSRPDFGEGRPIGCEVRATTGASAHFVLHDSLTSVRHSDTEAYIAIVMSLICINCATVGKDEHSQFLREIVIPAWRPVPFCTIYGFKTSPL